MYKVYSDYFYRITFYNLNFQIQGKMLTASLQCPPKGSLNGNENSEEKKRREGDCVAILNGMLRAKMLIFEKIKIERGEGVSYENSKQRKLQVKSP